MCERKSDAEAKMEGAVAVQSENPQEEKVRCDILLFNRWSYDDVQVQSPYLFLQQCFTSVFLFSAICYAEDKENGIHVLRKSSSVFICLLCYLCFAYKG